MWVRPDGIAHATVAKNPRSSMTSEFANSLDALYADSEGAVLDLILSAATTLAESLAKSSGASAVLGDSLPMRLLDGRFLEPTDLLVYLGSIDLQWRLDAYGVCTDYLRGDGSNKRLRKMGRVRQLIHLRRVSQV
ncbi:MAG: hypothetical protein ABIR57_10990 [Aeromicrobium sp.]